MINSLEKVDIRNVPYHSTITEREIQVLRDFFTIRACITVSYTHLDVYKRQVLRPASNSSAVDSITSLTIFFSSKFSTVKLIIN